MLQVNFNKCCMIIHVLYVKICTCCITIHFMLHQFSFLLYFLLSFMLYQHKYMLHQKNKFMLHQDLSEFYFFNHIYSEKLSSLAVACGPTTLQDLKLQVIATRNGVVFANHLSIFLHYVTCGFVAQP